jgi:ParB family transcriptional regulator, chromosome partitioning protein
MQIEYKKIIDLIPYEKNSRVHTQAQLEQIAASIKEFGFRNPVIVDGDNILAGHGRVEAAKKMGMVEVPTIDASDLNDEQKKAFIIADNKIALNGEWDESLLLKEIEDLKLADFDISVLAFDPSELQVKDIDYSILDEHDLDSQLDDLAKGVRKAIQIEFEPEHYEEAQALVKFWRDENAYVGYMIMQFLRQEKESL